MWYGDETAQVVLLPDGRLLHREDLPPRGGVPLSREARKLVARAVAHGLISEAEACSRYAVAPGEVARWRAALGGAEPARARVVFASEAMPRLPAAPGGMPAGAPAQMTASEAGQGAGVAAPQAPGSPRADG